jgi:hypothetical protein
VDKAVKNGIVQPGRYLILEFDFSCVARPRNMDESAEFLREEISIGLSRFKNHYTQYLGDSFALLSGRITQAEISDALLRLLILRFKVFMMTATRAIDYGAYKGYACSRLLHTIMHSNTYRSTC